MGGLYIERLWRQQPAVLEKMIEDAAAVRCWYAYIPSFIEWDWIQLNKSKFNATCPTWNRHNALVAISRILAGKVSSSRYRHFWIGADGSTARGLRAEADV